MDEKKFDVQQVCENGHQITSHYNEWPEERKYSCEKCGASTLTECPRCKQEIQGAALKYEYGHRKTLEDIVSVPKYCKNCGKPYPWTQKKIVTAVSVFEESKKMNKETTSEKENETRKSSEKQEGLLEPKAPEILQKILWILKYGRKHWKLILLAIGIFVILYIFAESDLFNKIWAKSGDILHISYCREIEGHLTYFISN